MATQTTAERVSQANEILVRAGDMPMTDVETYHFQLLGEFPGRYYAAIQTVRPGLAPTTEMVITDPMERLIADALDAAGIRYETDLGGGNPSGLDFRLENGVEIEVKQFHSPRVTEQMARSPNVIVAQGREAVEFLAELIRDANKVCGVCEDGRDY